MDQRQRRQRQCDPRGGDDVDATTMDIEPSDAGESLLRGSDGTRGGCPTRAAQPAAAGRRDDDTKRYNFLASTEIGDSTTTCEASCAAAAAADTTTTTSTESTTNGAASSRGAPLNASFDASLLAASANRRKAVGGGGCLQNHRHSDDNDHKRGHNKQQQQQQQKRCPNDPVPSFDRHRSDDNINRHEVEEPRNVAATSGGNTSDRRSIRSQLSSAASWDEHDNRQQQQLNAHFSVIDGGASELPHLPRTVRRSNGGGSGVAPPANTPARTWYRKPTTPGRVCCSSGIPNSTTQKKTPLAAGKLTPAKRQKAPLPHQQMRSPASSHHHHHHHPFPNRVSTATATNAGAAGQSSSSCLLNSSADDHSDDTSFSFGNGAAYTAVKKRPAKSSLGTHTTAGSSTAALLETTTDTIESIGDTGSDASSTPFRFTSFPASLPRIHNCPRIGGIAVDRNDGGSSSNGAGIHPPFPATVRKRMSFGNGLGSAAANHYNSSAHLDRSRENDDATHNTSINSSLLLDDHHGHYGLDDYQQQHDHRADDVATSRHNVDNNDDDTNHNTTSTTLGLPSPVGTPIPRARLNFSSVLSSPAVQPCSSQEEIGSTGRQMRAVYALCDHWTIAGI